MEPTVKRIDHRWRKGAYTMASSRKQLRQRLFARDTIVALGKRLIPRTDVRLHRLTNGRVSLASMSGVKILLLTTTGRRSGRTLVTPLTYIRDGDGYLVVGSNWGDDRNPTWALNLLADPRATLEIGGQRMAVTARLIEGDERVVTWKRLVELWPLYETYSAKVSRQLPVFLLTSRSAAASSTRDEPG
jgi:deazaflavin-dependent oxidoreductase (nitroreductase family)